MPRSSDRDFQSESKQLNFSQPPFIRRLISFHPKMSKAKEFQMTSRPQLDFATEWRCQQVARKENRSLAGAIAVLVDEAWTARLASDTAATLPAIPGSDDKERAARTIATHMAATRIAAVELLADKEHRSTSAMVNVLVAEALHARATASAS
jgi:hypothetical protein